MSETSLVITIDGENLDLYPGDFPLSITYQLEDTEDFQLKKSTEAFSVRIPASLTNARVSNSLHNAAIEDLTSNQSFRMPRRATITAQGYELLVGKAFLQSATHTNTPTAYEYDFYGNNGDWIIELRETTLYDVLKHINFSFSEETITRSWAFDGMNENLPYVFAPVRYRQPMDKDMTGNEDQVVSPVYLKPAISIFWPLIWGFRKAGYKIESSFFNTSYFRRMVMLWTWGNFLNAEGNRQDNIKFLAKGNNKYYTPSRYSGFADCVVTNTFPPEAFNNNDVYSYDAQEKAMTWTYIPSFNYGELDVTFNIQIDTYATASHNSDVEMRIQWLKNGSLVENGDHQILTLKAPTIGSRDFQGLKEDLFTVSGVRPGDKVSCKIYVHSFESGLGVAALNISVMQFALVDIRIPIGGHIDFTNYNGLKNFKFLDFLKGVIDTFNLLPGTDPINKIVTLEPAHPYKLSPEELFFSKGYFNGDFIDWSDKQDLTLESSIQLFSDYEREVTLRYKDDGNDGMLKVVQDRNVNILAAGKYVFPERFKSPKKDIENRFFSPVMHYDVNQWKKITGVAPQMICIIPENISNTSNDESSNTFLPKLAYYKGDIPGVGGWNYLNNGKIESRQSFPYMFAVNYQNGGENDPILSYSDEKIGNNIGSGLLRTFFLNRFAIMANGQYYSTYFNLKNFDVSNWLHREAIICCGQKWELIKIQDFQPLSDAPTACRLRKWAPITSKDGDSIYPSKNSILTNNLATGTFDVKYAQLKCLPSDIPGPISK